MPAFQGTIQGNSALISTTTVSFMTLFGLFFFCIIQGGRIHSLRGFFDFYWCLHVIPLLFALTLLN